jgi:hypothetical protein
VGAPRLKRPSSVGESPKTVATVSIYLHGSATKGQASSPGKYGNNGETLQFRQFLYVQIEKADRWESKNGEVIRELVAGVAEFLKGHG